MDKRSSPFPSGFSYDFKDIPPPPPFPEEEFNNNNRAPEPPPRVKHNKPSQKHNNNHNRQTPVILHTRSAKEEQARGNEQQLWKSMTTLQANPLAKHRSTPNEPSRRVPIAQRKFPQPPRRQQSLGITDGLTFDQIEGNPELTVTLEGNTPNMLLKYAERESDADSNVVNLSTSKLRMTNRYDSAATLEAFAESDGESNGGETFAQFRQIADKKGTQMFTSFADQPSKSKFDDQVFHWINVARTFPKSLIPPLKERISKFEDDTNNLVLSETSKLVTHEGSKAVEEAIAFLQKVSPVRKLTWNDDLSRVCEQHVEECGPKGTYSHKLKDGSQPTDRAVKSLGSKVASAAESLKFNCSDAKQCVLDFIIDDGIQSRGNRKNVFGDWDLFGCFTGPHKISNTMTTVVFVQSSDLTEQLMKKLLPQVTALMEDPKGWLNKKQQVLFTGEAIQVKNIYTMRDGSEQVVELNKKVDGDTIA